MKKPFKWDFRGRQSTRIPGYDYTQPGLYYVTICTEGRQYLFGRIENDRMKLNDAGMMIFQWWMELVDKYDTIRLDAFVIMPNHMHGIIELGESHYDPIHGIRSRVLPDDFERVHPHRDEIMAWIEERNATTSHCITITPLNNNPATRVGARFPRPEHDTDMPHHPDRGGGTPPLPTLGRVLAYWKYKTTRNLNLLQGTPGKRLWQRNYWDSIIRSDRDLENVREYILENSSRWKSGPHHRDDSRCQRFAKPSVHLNTSQ